MLALTLAASGAWAQSVALSGVLGSKALLVIDGSARRLRSTKATRRCACWVSGDSAMVEIKGQGKLCAWARPQSASAARRGQRHGSLRPARADSRCARPFVNRGYINGKTMQYMVDTGASTIAIGRADADHMGGLPARHSGSDAHRQWHGPGLATQAQQRQDREMEVYDIEAVTPSPCLMCCWATIC
ncbi:retroviral-like aspartic protease family protein [Staphylococcus epidermidis]|nr:retroviral-like aspartic protease family protein [Staphylococcus epidermidis]